jgi:hypothetical protein
MSGITLKQSSALNLELAGSIGTFKVSSSDSKFKTLEVKYFLTHVGIDFESGSHSGILSHIAPVRELFEPGTLEFDEIMQRDLDDARVSSELIPYLLDPGSRDLVKLFPPIIVVVLPTKANENKPADKYPLVRTPEPIAEGEDAYRTMRIISGKIGQEVFEFSQPLSSEGVPLDHDLARLKLNTQRTRLVIVDGQHRAMALLALYRNLNQEWTDLRRSPFRSYYEEWTPNYIQQFKLDKLSMPVMFCIFPELDETYSEDYDLKKASRAIFLALNKNAKKVSDSRNRLLDDNDLVALFLRKTLSTIKAKDIRSPHPLKIFNVELDQTHDKMRIDSPIAITGVNHIYYMIEHILLNKPVQDVNGIRPRKGRFSTRLDLEDTNAMSRLNGRNLLGSVEADKTRRDNFTTDTGIKLSEEFFKFYGSLIVNVLEQFKPFAVHCASTLWLEGHVKSTNSQNAPILFDGQGIYNVFNRHRDNLKTKHKNNAFGSNAAQIEQIILNLDAQAKTIDNNINELAIHRANEFISSIKAKSELLDSTGKISSKVIRFIDDLYGNIFTTVAFQSALIITFISSIEECFGIDAWNLRKDIIDVEFQKYLSDISNFFTPKSVVQFKNISDVFAGSVEGDATDWKITKTNYTFRSIVHSEEMQPDQWPKYKYLLLELWTPDSSELKESVDKQLVVCRKQVFKSLIDKKRDEWLIDNQKHEDSMTAKDHQKVQKTAEVLYEKLLKNLSRKEINNQYFSELLDSNTLLDDQYSTTEISEERWDSLSPDDIN